MKKTHFIFDVTFPFVTERRGSPKRVCMNNAKYANERVKNKDHTVWLKEGVA